MGQRLQLSLENSHFSYQTTTVRIQLLENFREYLFPNNSTEKTKIKTQGLGMAHQKQ